MRKHSPSVPRALVAGRMDGGLARPGLPCPLLVDTDMQIILYDLHYNPWQRGNWRMSGSSTLYHARACTLSHLSKVMSSDPPFGLPKGRQCTRVVAMRWQNICNRQVRCMQLVASSCLTATS